MGPIEIILAIAASWVMVFVVFAFGFLAGHYAAKLGGFAPKVPKIMKRTPKPVDPTEPVVPGVDVKAERNRIILRAKQEFQMGDADAARFADKIIATAGPILGQLHHKR